jgi:hypothetical protein
VLGLILSWVGYLMLGVAVVVGGVFGLAWLVAREVGSGGHGKGCPCPKCQARRLREHEHEQQQADTNVNQPSRPYPQDRKPPPGRSEWMATTELRPGMTVHGKTGKTFRVDEVTPIPYGFIVRLVADLTGTVARIPVSADQAMHKIWLVRKRKGPV